MRLLCNGRPFSTQLGFGGGSFVRDLPVNKSTSILFFIFKGNFKNSKPALNLKHSKYFSIFTNCCSVEAFTPFQYPFMHLSY
uniref:Uncharacterized protein n=1 Tax=Anguilla anguilla TaxID=7936 RepID=A0A0E9WW34_ANGAN